MYLIIERARNSVTAGNLEAETEKKKKKKDMQRWRMNISLEWDTEVTDGVKAHLNFICSNNNKNKPRLNL